MEEDSLWQYEQILLHGEDFEKSRTEIAEILGVTVKTLCEWDKHKIDWDKVNSETRKRYGNRIRSVDGAMFKKADKGDVNAAKLVYERFDGYTPTTANIDLSKKTDDELIEDSKKIIDEISKQHEAEAKQPGTGEAKA